MTGHLSEEQISAWVDGQLSSDERLLFEAHLPLCEMCRNIFEEMAKVNRLFRQDELTPSPDLWKRISAALDSPRPASWRRRLPQSTKEMWARAAAILLILLGGAWLALQYRAHYSSRQMAILELNRVPTILTVQHTENYNPFRRSPAADWNYNPFTPGRLGEAVNPFRTLARQ